VDPIEKAVQASAVEAIVRERAISQEQIEHFANLTLSNCYAIREAVNTGQVAFSSVVKLLDSADRFRNWLHQQPADAGLLQAYYQELIKDSWVDKLPGKLLRWSVFTTAGIVLDSVVGGGTGTVAGVGLSAADAFFMDRLIKGWKPHQFVTGELTTLFGG
jgi:hypothetical protein